MQDQKQNNKVLKIIGLIQLILSAIGALLVLFGTSGSFLSRQFAMFLFLPFFVIFLIFFWRQRKSINVKDWKIFILAIVFGLPSLIELGYSLLFIVVVSLAGGIDNP